MSITHSVSLIPLDRILIEDRLRRINETKAASMASSLADTGQITPIKVAPPNADGMYRLVAGAHRVRAAQIAKWTEIRAEIFDGSAEQARLQEIDENLYRSELSALEEAAFLSERRAIYETIHGKITRKRHMGQIAPSSFYEDVAERFGLSRDAVKRALQRSQNICDEAWMLLDGTPWAEKGVVLDALIKLGPQQQIAVMGKLRDGAAKNVAGALKALDGTAVEEDPAEQLLARLLALWAKADTDVKARFRLAISEKKGRKA
jgi:ParB family chromosome partitioning protein